MFDKTFIPFYVIAALFLTGGGYLTSVYLYEPNGDTEEEASVEINLPVIQLDQYLNLSKSIE